MRASDSLAGYEVVADLGSGGMASVHLAVKRQTGGFRKLFVLKVLSPELEDEEHVSMFREEANLAARLNHPNVVQTYEVGEDKGRHFLAMEYLEGQPLSAVVRKRGENVPLEVHVRVLLDVLEGLHYAHELTDFDGGSLGIVHRDVSPQNVFVTYAGVSKVIDFGIAKVSGSSQTREGIVKGKTGYMAPEQAGGKGIDRRADVFAAGVMLWEALARRRLVERGSDAVSAIMRRIAGSEPRIREVVPEVDPELATVCDRALAVEPAERYATADEMRLALQTWLRARGGGEARDVASVLDVFAEERSEMRRVVEGRIRDSSPTPTAAEGSRPGTGSVRRTAPELVGTVVGARYRLERPLGVGGMGMVFEATQLDLERRVAVKVLADVHPQRIERLRREALLAGNIRSPHVVSVFDFVAPPHETPFLVMEMLEGESLASLIERTRLLPLGRALRIASQILLGLEAAHEAGLVHRDIKPSNVWLQAGGGGRDHVKLLDFGIAKSLREDSVALTAAGAVAGTPEYVAPEQLKGLPVDARVDVHATGVVLYLMLYGQLPWRASDEALLVEILQRVPTPLHEHRAEVPIELSQVLARALEKDPNARFASASDMRRALAAFVLAEPEPFSRPSAPLRAAASVSHGADEQVARAYAEAGETASVPWRTLEPLSPTLVEIAPDAAEAAGPRPDTATEDAVSRPSRELSPRRVSRLGVASFAVASGVALAMLLAATVRRGAAEAPRATADASPVALAVGSSRLPEPGPALAPPPAPPVEVSVVTETPQDASAAAPKTPTPSAYPRVVTPSVATPPARPARRPIDDSDPYR